jgi:hypothetical protein
MQVEDKLTRVRLDIVRQVRQVISQKFGRGFYLYLTLSATNEFKDIYMNAFRFQFRDLSSRQTEKILFGSLNLAYALRASMEATAQPLNVGQIQEIAHRIIDAQMEDWYEWGAADLSPATR